MCCKCEWCLAFLSADAFNPKIASIECEPEIALANKAAEEVDEEDGDVSPPLPTPELEFGEDCAGLGRETFTAVFVKSGSRSATAGLLSLLSTAITFNIVIYFPLSPHGN